MKKLIVALLALALLTPTVALAGDAPDPVPVEAPTPAQERGNSTAYLLGSAGFEGGGFGLGARGALGVVLHESLTVEAHIGTSATFVRSFNSGGVSTRVFLGDYLNLGAGVSLHEWTSQFSLRRYEQISTGRQLTADFSFGLLWQSGHFHLGVDLYSLSLPIADLGGHRMAKEGGELVEDRDLDEGGTYALSRYLYLQAGVSF